MHDELSELEILDVDFGPVSDETLSANPLTTMSEEAERAYLAELADAIEAQERGAAASRRLFISA